MRGALVLVLVAGCEFDPGPYITPTDAPVDVPVDMIVPTWSVDGTSMKGVPANAAEWTQLLAAYGIASGGPSHVWGMQEASGGLADSIGTITLTPQNAPTYRNAVVGWTREGVGTIDSGANQGFISAATGDMNGTSYMLLMYVAVLATPSTQRSLAGLGANFDHRYVAVTSAGTFAAAGINVTPAAGSESALATVHPVVMKLQPAQQSYVVYTDREKLSPTWTNTSGMGNLLMVGNASVGAASARYLYGALWTGSAAELGDANVKKLLQGLGWTVSGY